MRKPTPQQRVDSILRYLSKMARLADHLHDRNGAGDYNHAWLIVAQRFYGRYRPVRFPQLASGYSRLSQAKPKTAEQALIQRAPLRRVKRRVPHLFRDRHRRTRYTAWTEHLDCGHQITAVFYAAGDKRPQRRKCRACAPPAKSRVLTFPREVSA